MQNAFDYAEPVRSQIDARVAVVVDTPREKGSLLITTEGEPGRGICRSSDHAALRLDCRQMQDRARNVKVVPCRWRQGDHMPCEIQLSLGWRAWCGYYPGKREEDRRI
ncbi:hypothetical protein [uncultured Sphingomonas sp.]|uniref:hypothetical protein n=1 Tax=uncultured Sphingomonas sp. TaxID=158754 RepID=UPI0035CA05A4